MLILGHFFVLLFIKSVEINAEIVNLKVWGKVDLKTALAIEKFTIFFKSNESVNSYNYTLNTSYLHDIQFQNETSNEKYNFQKTQEGSLIVYKIDLNATRKSTITATITYRNKIKPLFKKRKIREHQFMRFEGDSTFFSPYKTVYSKVEFVFKNDSLTSIEPPPEDLNDENIWYKFKNYEKFTSKPVEVEFINNSTFLCVRKLQRTVDINHYGKILIEDKVDVENIGTQFTGPYEFGTKATVRVFYTFLPASADNIKVSDNVGLNTAWVAENHISFLQLAIKPRFLLLGGWKISYVINYQVPTYEYLYTQKDMYKLNIRAIDYVLHKTPIDDATVKILIPEGGRVVNIKPPNFLTYKKTVVCTNLCVSGRPLIVLNGKNLIDDYVKGVQIDYYFPNIWMLRAPFVLILYIQALFLSVILVQRIK